MFNFGDPLGNNKNAGRDKRRSFTQVQKNQIRYQQNDKCAKCHKPLDPRTTRYDHNKPWADKGRTITENGRALHADCHAIKHHDEQLKKIEKKSTKAKKPANPFDVSITPMFKWPKTPKGKGGSGGLF